MFDILRQYIIYFIIYQISEKSNASPECGKHKNVADFCCLPLKRRKILRKSCTLAAGNHDSRKMLRPGRNAGAGIQGI